MKSTPKGWPRISSGVSYEEPKKAIDFLCKAFGFEVRLLVEGEEGRVDHSELVFGDGLVMVGGGGGKSGRPGREWRASPREVGDRCTQTMMVFVDDVEAHCAQARSAGAVIFEEPATHDYGEAYWADRTYGAVDPEGHRWWFTQRIRDPKA